MTADQLFINQSAVVVSCSSLSMKDEELATVGVSIEE